MERRQAALNEAPNLSVAGVILPDAETLAIPVASERYDFLVGQPARPSCHRASVPVDGFIEDGAAQLGDVAVVRA
jgi:hypothetical protein